MGERNAMIYDMRTLVFFWTMIRTMLVSKRSQ